MLQSRQWLVEHTHGNAYQTGFPDLFIAHRRFGTRWIDCKNPVSYTFTKAQRKKWPLWREWGVGIWILTAATEEEYDKLFKSPNWYEYWKAQWDVDMAELDNMVDFLNEPDTSFDD